jgi:threonine/homoserine/homoserine lactone efflux protein
MMDNANLLSILFPIAVIQIIGWAVPGPNHLTIVTASVTAGRPAGIKAALGIASGALTWTLIAVSGIAVVFELVPSLYMALRLFGAVYLIYLGANAFRAVRRGGMFSLDANAKSPATYAPCRTAYCVMMTNPKAVLFFGSILTAFIPPESPGWLMLAIAVQVGLLGVLLNVFAAILFSSAVFIRSFQAAGTWMSVLFGVLFSALGALVAWDVIRDFVSN